MHKSTLLRPKITICVVSYNQETFIELCLNSIVTQECDYDFEILVSDDCSTDNTGLIIADFEQRFSNITVLKRNNNIGALENFKQTHEAATGDFICHCDGDDYWLPGKLQKQAEFLMLNPNCNIVWTRMMIRNDALDLDKPDLLTDGITSKKFFRNDIIQFVAIGLHSSKMYRKKSLNYGGFPIVDYFANVQHVADGYATFASDEVFGVYRAGIGIASSGNGTKIIISKSLDYFNTTYPESRVHVTACALFLAVVELKNRRLRNSIRYLTNIKFEHIISSIKLIKINYPLLKHLRFPKFERD